MTTTGRLTADLIPWVLFGFGIPGFKEVVLVTLVALALYGRSGSRFLTSSPYGRALRPWLSLARAARPGSRNAAVPPKPKPHGPVFWAFALTAAAVLAAWVATRVVIHHASAAL